MKILVTGFNPFGNEKINPASEVAKRLPDQIGKNKIMKLQIPTEFNHSAEVVKKQILKSQPDYVLNIGLAGGRRGITPELMAINLNDSRIRDNAGYQPLNEPIQKDGQNAYFTELPIRAIVKSIRDLGFPSRISTTAGTYVCNHIMYQVQYMIDKEFHHLKAGFIHIPFLPQQVSNQTAPSMTLDGAVQSITAAIKTIIKMDGKKDLNNVNHVYKY
ncbi:pyrrolidone-carboxylate peptidase [Philodulcilactobacillus myokoensis]|uniref:Pyrrolidone-carboxylate peptidase n=1 Tax=Philodulcilactobacillus myokoensis TaxID=2929573 RepID=A0A9W6B4Z4_9LACO|nr:pyroglutamyl-peptidase I [Philodulcilactobacillus myokoensis]GLB47564.1 pyrrolidone-carboxylate peptidase [Philodulcilactobacillus myokoensis]